MEASTSKILPKLRALFAAITEEAAANPAFAAKVEAALALDEPDTINQAPTSKQEKKAAAPSAKPKQADAHQMLHNVTFDPLECHIEAALLNGREQEARAFLGKLDKVQLEEVVKAQRLPGAKMLQKVILETADTAAVVDAIVVSAAAKVRNRYSAAS
jgi:hypothetical protein